MPRKDVFALRVSDDERRLLAAVAKRLQRSQSDAVRLLIRTAADELVRSGTGADTVQEASHARA